MGIITIAEKDVEKALTILQEHFQDRTTTWDFIHFQAVQDRESLRAFLHNLFAHVCYCLGTETLPGSFMEKLAEHLAFAPQLPLLPAPVPVLAPPQSPVAVVPFLVEEASEEPA